jgi:hypothetical protein
LRFAPAVLLALAATGAAAEPEPAVRMSDPPPALLPVPPLPRFGLAVDAGLPGGIGLLAQARILDGLRIQAGPLWSGVGWGLKGGVVVSPFRWTVAPVFEAEAGWGVHADLSFLARRSDVPHELGPVLARASYAYAAGYLGLDVGDPRGVSFFLRGGLARLTASAPGTARTAADGGGTLTVGDASLRAIVPCAKLGLQVWFR